MNKKKILEALILKCRMRGFKIAFPESSDSRIVEAARFLLEQKVVDQVVFFQSEFAKTDVEKKYNRSYFNNFSSNMILCEEKYPQLDLEMKEFFQQKNINSKKKFSKEEIDLIVKQGLYKSVYLLREKRVDCVLAGCQLTTSEVIRCGLRVLDLSKNNNTLSSSFLMFREASEQQEAFISFFADCGVVIDPSCEQIQDITKQTILSLNILKNIPLFSTLEPIVAFLSFSTKGSARHPRVEKMRNSFEIFRNNYPLIKCEGEIQFDAAYIQSIREKKIQKSSIDSMTPNIFIFPSLEAGNISYKIAQYLGGCMALGPILQGFNRSLCDLSRGASVEDIIFLSCLNLIKSKYEKNTIL